MEVVADTVGSLGVLIAGVVTITTHWPYADVVVAVLVALWVLPRAISLARAALRILSEIVAKPHRRRGAAFGAGRRRRCHRRTRPARVDAVTRQGHVHRAPDQYRGLRPGAAAMRARCCSARGLEHATVQIECPDGTGQLRSKASRTAIALTPGGPRGRNRRANPDNAADSSVSPMASAARASAATHRKKPAIGLVRIRHRAETLPAVAAQLVQAAVVAGARVGVGGDGLVVGQRLLGKRRPGHRRRRMRSGDDGRGFRRPSSSVSASMSPGSRIGSGPRRSRVGVMVLFCRGGVAKLQRMLMRLEPAAAPRRSLGDAIRRAARFSASEASHRGPTHGAAATPRPRRW